MDLEPHPPTPRPFASRAALRLASALAAALALSAALPAHAAEAQNDAQAHAQNDAQAESSPADLVFVHMSDTHLATGAENPEPRHPLMPHTKDLVQSPQWLEAAVAKINEQIEPDFVVITGDVVDGAGEHPGDIERARAILDELDCPYHVTIGNHDRRAEADFLRIFDVEASYAFTHGRWRFIALDGSRSVLSDEALALLERELAAAAKADERVVVLNHYPLTLPQWVLDVAATVYPRQLTVRNAEDALALLDAHEQVKLVLAGHIHHELDHERRGVPHLTTGALIKQPHQFRVVRIRGDRITWQLHAVHLANNNEPASDTRAPGAGERAPVAPAP